MSAEAWVGVTAIVVTVLLAIAGGVASWMHATYRLALSAVNRLDSFTTAFTRFIDESREENEHIWHRFDEHGRQITQHGERIVVLESKS